MSNLQYDGIDESAINRELGKYIVIYKKPAKTSENWQNKWDQQ